MLFIIPGVLAIEFDNRGFYNETTRTMEIKNCFGLCSTIGTIRLVTPKSVWVEPGDNRLVAVLEFNQTLGGDYGDALKQIDFYNYDNMRKRSKIFTYMQQVQIGTHSVDDYKEECGIEKNGSAYCKQVVSGSHLEPTYEWQEYSGKTISKGTITIGIFTDVSEGEHTEWIPEFYGVRIEEWADFTGYTKYEFCHATGSDMGSGKDMWRGQVFELGGAEFGETMDLAGVQIAYKYAKNDVAEGLYVGMWSVNASKDAPGSELVYNSSITLADLNASGGFYNITLPSTTLNNDTNYTIVINTTAAGTDQLRILSGACAYGSEWYSADDGGKWTEEAADFWFEVYGSKSAALTSTLNSPADNFVKYDNRTIVFNCSATAVEGVVNLTLWIDDNQNYTETNTTTGNLSLYRVVENIAESFHNWTCAAKNSSSDIAWATNRSFEVANSSLAICGTYPFLNITFQDEKNDSEVGATITNSWSYGEQGGTISNTNTYSNSTAHNSYAFCYTPVEKNASINGTSKFDSTSYPEREYAIIGNYTNITTNLTFYLLSSGDGSYVTFQVLDASENPISNVDAKAETQLGGSWTQIDSGITDDAGGVTFWVNPDASHRFTFTKTGYDEVTTTLTPSQSTYTVYMGGNLSDAKAYDFSRGISFIVEPNGTILINDTTYGFNFTITSNYWTLTEYGFVLFDDSNNEIGSGNGVVGGGGKVTVIKPVGDNETISMNYYWAVGGNYSNGTKMWYVYDDTDFGFGLKTFFDDLKSYTDDEIFGLNDFSRTLIIFVIIFITIGLISYTSGMYSPAAISVELFVMVLFFDVVLGLLPSGNAVTHFPTIVTGLIMGILLIREGMK